MKILSEISVVICTYNRNEILRECLQQLAESSCEKNLFEVIVIDNYCQLSTKSIVEEFANLTKLIAKYFEVKEKGLSIARNKGFEVASSPWIFYLDDDAIIDKSYIVNALSILRQGNIHCLGGLYIPWYKTDRPKWYRDEWGASLNKPDKFSILSKDQFLDGNNFIIEKKVLHNMQGFRSDLGMIAYSVGYGEETELQIRLRKQGYHIYYSPDLVVRHLVADYKLSVYWLLKSWYNHGKSYWATYHVTPTGYRNGVGKLFKIISIAFNNIVVNFHLLLSREYYIQNLLIDSFREPVWELGRLVNAIKSHVRN